MISSRSLISVIIPVANGERYLEECIESALGQNYPNTEIVIANDASTDSSMQIVQRFIDRGERIRVVNLEKRSGVAAARNAAIAHSHGDLIATLDADDVWRSDKLSRQLAAMMAGGDDIGMVYCWVRRIDDSGRFLSKGAQLQIDGDIGEEIMRRSFTGGGSTPLMRASLVREVGGYDSRYFRDGVQGSEDTDLYLKIALCSLVAVVTEPLVDYRYTDRSMSSNREQMLEAGLAVRRRYQSQFPDVDLDRIYANLHLLESMSRETRGFANRKRAFARALELDTLVVWRATVNRHNLTRVGQFMHRMFRGRRDPLPGTARPIHNNNNPRGLQPIRKVDTDRVRRDVESPLVSIVIPVFNQERYVAQAIESVARQTYDNIEIIAVDDRSTDGTGRILTELSGRIPNLKICSLAINGGVCAARNAGIRKAAGQFVLPLDADDLMHPDAVTALVNRWELAERSGERVTLAWGSLVKLDADGAVPYTREPLISPPRQVEGYGFCEANLVGSGSGALFRTRDALELGGYDSSLRENFGEGTADWVFYLELASRGNVVAIPDVTVGYRKSEYSMSSDTDAMYHSYEAVDETIARLFPNRVADFSRARAKLLFAVALESARKRQFGVAAEYFFRCAKENRSTAFARIKRLVERRSQDLVRRTRHQIHLGGAVTDPEFDSRLDFSDYCELLCGSRQRNGD